MKNYRHEAITQSVEIRILASALTDEIKYIYKPLLEYIDKQNYEITPDHFNPIRILMPLIEVASKIEFGGDPRFLLEKLKVPKPDVIWPMFRHGLSHYVRPFYVIIKDQRINWAIPQYPCEHYETVDAIGIYPPKLLKDLKNYLQSFYGNSNTIQIQMGLKLIKNIKAK